MSVAVHTSTDLDIAPIAGYLGADVSGISLAEEISPENAERLRNALFEYKVLFFRDPPLGGLGEGRGHPARVRPAAGREGQRNAGTRRRRRTPCSS